MKAHWGVRVRRMLLDVEICGWPSSLSLRWLVVGGNRKISWLKEELRRATRSALRGCKRVVVQGARCT